MNKEEKLKENIRATMKIEGFSLKIKYKKIKPK